MQWGMQINDGYVYPQNKDEALFMAGNKVQHERLQQFIMQSQDAGLADRDDFFIFNVAGGLTLVQKLMDKQNNTLRTGASNGRS